MADEKKMTMSQRFAGLKTEFSKIIWPETSSIGRQSAAVIILSVVIAFVIAILDMVIQHGVDFLVGL